MKQAIKVIDKILYKVISKTITKTVDEIKENPKLDIDIINIQTVAVKMTATNFYFILQQELENLQKEN